MVWQRMYEGGNIIVDVTYVGFRTKMAREFLFEIWAGNYYALKMRAKNNACLSVEKYSGCCMRVSACGE